MGTIYAVNIADYRLSMQNIGTDIDRYLTDVSLIFPISAPFFLVLPLTFLLIVAISCLLQLLVFCKLQKVNLLMVGEYTELLLNCNIYKFIMILKLPISHRDYRYLKYRSLTDILFL
ncbi:hypothetical protein Hanom_Chr10g00885571 [Helianthus anomalus]